MSLRGATKWRRGNLKLKPRLLTCTGVRRKCRQATAFLATTWLITSCAGLDSLNTISTPQFATETPLPTSTIIWFPPSATPTLGVFTTIQPTPEMRPGLGTKFLNDDFSDPTLWDIAASDQASAEIDNNNITVAVQSEVYMTSLRHELILDDYYAEITARPNLCRGNDSYGMLIHANSGQYYRFALACNGTVYADRLSNGSRLNIQKPLASGDAPPGAPGEVRIGVWTVGSEMRLFLNGRYQFSVTDPSYPGGTLGVFVKSAGDTAAIISFSDLVIQEINYIPPTKTPLP